MILCGRFEGVDQRVIEARGLEELSLGDIVLSGGEPAAIALIDARGRSDAAKLRLRVERVGDAHAICGEKTSISAAVLARKFRQ